MAKSRQEGDLAKLIEQFAEIVETEFTFNKFILELRLRMETIISLKQNMDPTDLIKLSDYYEPYKHFTDITPTFYAQWDKLRKSDFDLTDPNIMSLEGFAEKVIENAINKNRNAFLQAAAAFNKFIEFLNEKRKWKDESSQLSIGEYLLKKRKELYPISSADSSANDQKDPRNQSMQGLLVAIVAQRFTRYPLLLKEIIKECDEKFKSKTSKFSKLLLKIEDIAANINSAIDQESDRIKQLKTRLAIGSITHELKKMNIDEHMFGPYFSYLEHPLVDASFVEICQKLKKDLLRFYKLEYEKNKSSIVPMVEFILQIEQALKNAGLKPLILIDDDQSKDKVKLAETIYKMTGESQSLVSEPSVQHSSAQSAASTPLRDSTNTVQVKADSSSTPVKQPASSGGSVARLASQFGGNIQSAASQSANLSPPAKNVDQFLKDKKSAVATQAPAAQSASLQAGKEKQSAVKINPEKIILRRESIGIFAKNLLIAFNEATASKLPPNAMHVITNLISNINSCIAKDGSADHVQKDPLSLANDFHQYFFDAYADAYILKTDIRKILEIIRELMSNIDAELTKLNPNTVSLLPRSAKSNSEKNKAVFSAFGDKEFINKKITQFSAEIKEMKHYQTTNIEKHALKNIFNNIMEAVTRMGDEAIKIWNSYAKKDFPSLEIPNVRDDKKQWLNPLLLKFDKFLIELSPVAMTESERSQRIIMEVIGHMQAYSKEALDNISTVGLTIEEANSFNFAMTLLSTAEEKALSLLQEFNKLSIDAIYHKLRAIVLSVLAPAYAEEFVIANKNLPCLKMIVKFMESIDNGFMRLSSQPIIFTSPNEYKESPANVAFKAIQKIYKDDPKTNPYWVENITAQFREKYGNFASLFQINLGDVHNEDVVRKLFDSRCKLIQEFEKIKMAFDVMNEEIKKSTSSIILARYQAKNNLAYAAQNQLIQSFKDIEKLSKDDPAATSLWNEKLVPSLQNRYPVAEIHTLFLVPHTAEDKNIEKRFHPFLVKWTGQDKKEDKKQHIFFQSASANPAGKQVAAKSAAVAADKPTTAKTYSSTQTQKK